MLAASSRRASSSRALVLATASRWTPPRRGGPRARHRCRVARLQDGLRLQVQLHDGPQGWPTTPQGYPKVDPMEPATVGSTESSPPIAPPSRQPAPASRCRWARQLDDAYLDAAASMTASTKGTATAPEVTRRTRVTATTPTPTRPASTTAATAPGSMTPTATTPAPTRPASTTATATASGLGAARRAAPRAGLPQRRRRRRVQDGLRLQVQVHDTPPTWTPRVAHDPPRAPQSGPHGPAT